MDVQRSYEHKKNGMEKNAVYPEARFVRSLTEEVQKELQKDLDEASVLVQRILKGLNLPEELIHPE